MRTAKHVAYRSLGGDGALGTYNRTGYYFRMADNPRTVATNPDARWRIEAVQSLFRLLKPNLGRGKSRN